MSILFLETQGFKSGLFCNPKHCLRHINAPNVPVFLIPCTVVGNSVIVSFEVQGESQCKDALIGGLEDGADVFTFADDQLNTLAAAGALTPIENADEIRNRNLSSTVEAAAVNDQLYAYPLTADNGYFSQV